jgi:GNAT superfamily N-acetyltransferase
MKIIETITLTKNQKQTVFRLWNQEYPNKLKHLDISDLDNYFSNLTDTKHFILTGDTNKILGWSFAFQRDGEKWFAMILDSKVHKQGYGTLLLNKLKDKEINLYGWVIDHDREIKENGENYKSPLGFYLKNSFKTIPTVRLELDKISAVKIKWTK